MASPPPTPGTWPALPAAEVAPLESGAAESADAVVDVALIVTGRPSPPGEAPRHLRLRAHPAHVLRVAAVTRLIDVHPDRIRWRTSAHPRPWLEGIMQSPAAAVLSVAELVKEAQRGE